MYTSEEFAERVLALRAGYGQAPVPVAFWEEMVMPWFDQVFPQKNEIYGVDGLQRLGPTHAVADFVGCVYRWKRMRDLEFDMTMASMLNAAQDAFGYSVLMRAMAQTEISWDQVGKFNIPVDDDLERLLQIYWDIPMPVDVAAVTMATRISINMYRGTPGA